MARATRTTLLTLTPGQSSSGGFMRPIVGAIIIAAGALAAPLTLRAQQPAPAGGNKPRAEQPRPAPPRERPDRDRPKPEAKPDRRDERRDPPDRPRSTGEPELKRRKPR